MCLVRVFVYAWVLRVYVGATERSLSARQARGRAMLLEMEGSSLERGGDDCSAGPLTASKAEVMEGAAGRNGDEHFSAGSGVNEGREGGSGGDSGSSEEGVEEERLLRGMIDRQAGLGGGDAAEADVWRR